MLFGNLFKRQAPRGLSWTPRYHDPDADDALPGGEEFDPHDDIQYEAMRRQSRIQFERYRNKTASSRRGPSPFLLLFFVVLVGVIIFGTQMDMTGPPPDVRMGSDAAMPDPAGSASRAPKDLDMIAGEELIIQIERGGEIISDTIRGRDELKRLLEEQGLAPDNPDSQ